MPRFLLLALLFSSFSSLFAVESPLVDVHVSGMERPAGSSTLPLLVVLRNKTAGELRDVEVFLKLEAEHSTLSATDHPAWNTNWSCGAAVNNVVRCVLPVLPGPPAFIPLVANIANAQYRRFALTAHAAWTMDGESFTSAPYMVRGYLPRELAVTSSADAGPGSFRETLELANRECNTIPCRIGFDIDEPLAEGEWHTIRPRTPLPPIVAGDLEIRHQVHFYSHIELDGSLLSEGHGLDVRGTGEWAIQGLSIGGFPWDGITVSRSAPEGAWVSATVESCWIGRRPDNTPNPNGSRGITVNLPAANLTIAGNHIGPNDRSGIFVAGGTNVRIAANSIGRQEFTTVPWANGASGVYVGPDARHVRFVHNFIIGNAHAGISIARGARDVRLFRDRITGNGGIPVDHGLNGFSGTVRNGTDPRTSHLPAPKLVSATFDPVSNTTTVRGTFDAPDPARQWKVALLFNSWAYEYQPYPEATFTGTEFAVTAPGEVTLGAFRAVVDSVTEGDWSTSEYSEN